MDTARRVLIVDDDASFRRLLRVALQDEYTLAEAADGESALRLVHLFQPAVILLDLGMPGVNGFETCRQIKANPHTANVQVVIVSGRSARTEQLLAFEKGADDYVVKPIELQGFRARLALHFRLRGAEADAAAIRGELGEEIGALRRLTDERARELIATQDSAIFALAKVAEYRDEDTGDHLDRIRAYVRELTEELARSSPYASEITPQFIEDLCRSSVLHDIGKVAIGDAILLKPGRLTPDEMERMREHSALGAAMLERAVLDSPGGGFLAMAGTIARSHHERFDGTGYPDGLAGQEIPLGARIVAVADVYDALTSKRPYKPAYSSATAEAMIRKGRGTQFDPVVVDAFERCRERFIEIRRKLDATQKVEVHGAVNILQRFKQELATAEAVEV